MGKKRTVEKVAELKELRKNSESDFDKIVRIQEEIALLNIDALLGTEKPGIGTFRQICKLKAELRSLMHKNMKNQIKMNKMNYYANSEN